MCIVRFVWCQLLSKTNMRMEWESINWCSSFASALYSFDKITTKWFIGGAIFPPIFVEKFVCTSLYIHHWLTLWLHCNESLSMSYCYTKDDDVSSPSDGEELLMIGHNAATFHTIGASFFLAIIIVISHYYHCYYYDSFLFLQNLTVWLLVRLNWSHYYYHYYYHYYHNARNLIRAFDRIGIQ